MTRRVSGLTAIALLVAASPAWAGGVNFAWNDCLPEGGRTGVRFDCTASTIVQDAVGSFMLNNPMPDFYALEIVVDLQAEAATLPAWWTFSPSPGACRDSSLTMSFDFSSLANVACADPFGWPVVGALLNYLPSGNRARIIGIASIPPDEFGQSSSPLEAKKEYYGFRLRLRLDRATGAGACAGCATEVQLVLNSIGAVGVAENSFELCASPISLDPVIDWQCASCATPTLNRTWGQLKSLYR